MLRAHVKHLPGNHAVHTRRAPQDADALQNRLRGQSLSRRCGLKRCGQQPITREHGGRLIERSVAGRAAAAQVVVVHARQVVVDE